MKRVLILIVLALGGLSTRGFSQTPEPARVCFYEHAHYTGGYFCLVPGQRVRNLVPHGWNNVISSILVQGDAVAKVYRNPDFLGRSIRIRASPYALSLQLNDAISSVKVVRRSGRQSLYSD